DHVLHADHRPGHRPDNRYQLGVPRRRPEQGLLGCRQREGGAALGGAALGARAPQAVAAFRSSSWRRTPAIIDARSEVSITMSNPRFTAPAAKAALAQCMTALMPCLWAVSRILSQVAMCTASVLSGPGGSPSANERSAGPM